MNHKLSEFPGVLTAIIDFKTLAFVTGSTPDAYRWISAMLLNAALLKMSITSSKYLTFRFIKWLLEHNYYELLRNIGDSECVAGLLERVIQSISSFMDVKRFVLLIDEYEHLFERTFGEANGFMYIRKLKIRSQV